MPWLFRIARNAVISHYRRDGRQQLAPLETAVALPADAEDPVIVKGTGMTFALMYLAAQNPNMTPEELNEYLERVVRPRVTNIQGVAQMEILGAQKFAMRIWLDPLKLSSRGVTASEVLAAIRSSNFLSAPGKTENEYFSYALTLDSTIQTPDSFGALPLVQGAEGVVRLPSALAMTVIPSPSRTATQLFVVPRSIPTTFAILGHPILSFKKILPGNTRIFSRTSAYEKFLPKGLPGAAIARRGVGPHPHHGGAQDPPP